jgi:hypothetical protein
MGQHHQGGQNSAFFWVEFLAGFNPGDWCRGIYSVLQLL